MKRNSAHAPFIQHIIGLCFDSDADVFYADTQRPLPNWEEYIAEHLDDSLDESLLRERLCWLRKRAHGWIMAQDLSGRIDCYQACLSFAQLADAIIAWVENYYHRQLVLRYGEPRDAAGHRMRLIVMGMGKLGGKELNASSDIDLIFVYPSEGECLHPISGRKTEASQFFIRLTQLITRLLHEPCQNGFVYRVDTRLRPFGTAGAKACNFEAMEWYYQSHARAWERFALGKARAITGIALQVESLQKMLQAFVYRRYLDFSIIEDLRDTKALIKQQVDVGDNWNVKLGDGGIREIEFFIQSFQLIYGGRNAQIRGRGVGEVLPQLLKQELLDADTGQSLKEDFYFLRALENRLQYWREEQTHTLPEDKQQQAWLADSLGYGDFSALEQGLKPIRQRVRQLFASIAEENQAAVDWLSLSGAQHRQRLSERSEEWLSVFSAFCQRCEEMASSRSKKRLNRLLSKVAASSDLSDTLVLRRCLDVLKVAVERSTYLALLDENEAAFDMLTRTTAHSNFLSKELSSSPALMDLFLSPLVFETAPNRASIRQDAKNFVQRSESIEQRLYALHVFKRRQHFKAAYAHLNRLVGVKHLGLILTWTAEVVVREALRICLAMMRESGYMEEHIRLGTLPMLVLGYGKLGSGELGFSSDLDLVILYDEKGRYEGTVFVRMARKLVQLLGALTTEGRLYEVDTRLRPDGGSGTLVVSLEQFEEYQMHRAWLWEKQALLKAHPIAGSCDLARRFYKVRGESLCTLALPDDTLRSEILAMREKMRSAHELSAQNVIKHGQGGLIDAEFLSQYLMLKHLPENRRMLRARSVHQQLEMVAAFCQQYAQLAQQVQAAYSSLQNNVTDAFLKERVQLEAGKAMDCIAEHYNAQLCR